MGRVTFDGDEIYVRPPINHEDFMKWKARQDEDLSKIIREEREEESGHALNDWKRMVPVLYRGATLDAVREYDDHAAGVMKDLSQMVQDDPEIPRHLAISSETVKYIGDDGKTHRRAIKGKTWAAYAYIDQIVRTTNLITDPEHEIICVQESSILNDLYGFATRKRTLDRLTRGRKILMIDSCGQMTGYDAKNRSDCYTTLIDAVNAIGTVNLILVMSSSAWVLQEFKPLVERLQPKARRLMIRNEPDGIADYDE